MPVLAQGADTVYYNKDGQKLKAKTDPQADYFTITTYTDTTQTESLETKKSYYLGGKKKSEAQYTVDRSKGYKVKYHKGLYIGWHKNGQLAYKADYPGGVQEGPYTQWFEDGCISHLSHYRAGKKEGEAFDYHLNGKIKRQETFANNELVSGKCFTQAGADTVYFPHYEPPVFQGGASALMQFLSQHLVYPKKAIRQEIEGLVVVQFVVNKQGKVTDMKLVKKIMPELDRESLRVVQLMSGKFQPGKQEGKPVSSMYTLPVRFALRD
ncbi:MAG: TonB family protein [Adhaeribacter sp.]